HGGARGSAGGVDAGGDGVQSGDVPPEVGEVSAVVARAPRARLAARVLPLELFEARRPQRLLERHFMIVRSGEWMILLSGFFEPLFYLLSVQVGFGALVGDVVDG